LALGAEARIGIRFRPAAQENIASVAWRFWLVILTLGDYDQHAWGNRLPRPIREIYEAFPLETIEGLICRMPVHRALVAWYAMVNPDMIVVGIEKQSFMLAGSRSFERRVLVNINTFGGHKDLRYYFK